MSMHSNNLLVGNSLTKALIETQCRHTDKSLQGEESIAQWSTDAAITDIFYGVVETAFLQEKR